MPVPNAFYNQKSHFLLAGSGATTTYIKNTTLNTKHKIFMKVF